MSNEKNKDFNAMLSSVKDMPRVDIVTDEDVIKRYGGSRMFFAPPLYYNEVMKRVPEGKVVTIKEIRSYLSKNNDADFTEPMTAGAFIGMVAWASEQRAEDKVPYWRTLKANGEINPKFPGGIEKQKQLLAAEGHTFITKGRKHIRYFVADFENKLADIT